MTQFLAQGLNHRPPPPNLMTAQRYKLLYGANTIQSRSLVAGKLASCSRHQHLDAGLGKLHVIKLYTFSITFPRCFSGSPHQGAGGMDVRPRTAYIMKKIDLVGVTNRVPLQLESISSPPPTGLPVKAALSDSSRCPRNIRSLEPRKLQ